MQTASDSATIAMTSNAINVTGADGEAKLGEEISLRAVPDTKVESNVPMRPLIAERTAALARIRSAAEIRRRNRDRANCTEFGHDLELVAHLLERVARRLRHRLFDDHDVRCGLFMNSRLSDGASGIEMEREDV